MEVVKGYVDHIVFRNEDNGYTVFELTNEDGEITCVGELAFISAGELVEVTGEYVNHNVYGEQLQVSSYEVLEPEDLFSIERYLGSGAIKGVGVKLAGSIVRKFKGDTFRIIEEEPERLAEIKGISERMAREIAIQVEEKKEMRRAMIYLQRYGITLSLAAKIYEQYGNSLYRVLEENPYQLADQVAGVGFKTADDIAMKIGIHTDSDFRIRSGIFYVLLESVADGHIYLPKEVLLRRAKQLLELDIADIDPYLMDLAMEKKIVVKEVEEEEDRVYAAQFYYMELRVAKMLLDLNVSCETSQTLVEKRLQKIEHDAGMELDEMQRLAVMTAVGHGITILTGGPGTGKTTTIHALIEYFRSEGMSIELAAPTGRAAKRMTEATGYEARTVHRLLELNYLPDDTDVRLQFGRNEENPLDADVIIIDEMSMIDLSLLHTLLRAVVPGMRLIFVGDQDQLPSVGPGNVLKDLIASGAFPVITLQKIFRQAEQSDIVLNAHKINRGEPLVLDNKSKDFFFLKRDDANVIIRVLLSLIQERLPKYVGAKPLDIQVLTPMRKGLLGVERLNEILQQYLNPSSPKKAEKEHGDRLFRVGDKVMQVKNNYQIVWEIETKYGQVIDSGVGVFNGDMGQVVSIDTYDEKLTVQYEEKKRVRYDFSELDELELAYAVTVHKSQGSEYPAVVIPLLSGPRQLYHRNLIYTAVTRAKRCVAIVGSDVVLQEMIENENSHRRFTSLDEQIKDMM